MPSILHAGPWVGEFGWELCSWNPFLRHISQKYDRVIVEGPASSEYLYEFADEYRPNESLSIFADEYKGRGESFSPEPGATIETPSPGKHGKPEKRSFGTSRHTRPFKTIPSREWRYLPEKVEHVADVLCAFRPPKVVKRKPSGKKRTLTDKEYPQKRCEQLVNLLIKANVSVACIGGLDNYYVKGSIDLRGAPLKSQCNAMAGAKVCVGPSSAPLHLASLCKTPHVVWYNRIDQVSSRARYTNYWNPFGTPFTYMKQNLPTSEEVMETLQEYLK